MFRKYFYQHSPEESGGSHQSHLCEHNTRLLLYFFFFNISVFLVMWLHYICFCFNINITKIKNLKILHGLDIPQEWTTSIRYPEPTTGICWEDLYHRWRSMVGHKQILATLASQILEIEIFPHKVIYTKNQVQRLWLEWQSESPGLCPWVWNKLLA